MGKYTSTVNSIALTALSSGRSVDAAVADYRRSHNLDENDNPRTTTFYRVEYRNRDDDGTHFGKIYKKQRSALKNQRGNDRFIRVVQFDSV